jgi:hypothetical protein
MTSHRSPLQRIVIFLCLAATGCSPQPTMKMETAEAPDIEQSQRVEVLRIGVIADDLAYRDRRGVYVIRDNVTGKEFIGVSGVGITETGRHSCGKNCWAQDER